MDKKLEEFRRCVAELGPRRTGRRFSSELMALAREYSLFRRGEGASWQRIADELGISMLTIRKWSDGNADASCVFRRVRVEESRRASGFAVTLGSLRVEGLSLDELVTLTKALS